MNLTDFFIIYFAAGAPFAVYYFFQRRANLPTPRLLAKTLFVFVCWLPFAVKTLRKSQRRRIFQTVLHGEARRESEINRLQKQIERGFSVADSPFSIFDLREIFARYIGLTAAVAHETGAGEREKEIFRAADAGHFAVGAICLERRNRLRLIRHQTEARADFVNLIEKMSADAKAENPGDIRTAALAIADCLDDSATRANLEKTPPVRPQNAAPSSVNYSEKDLWKTHEPQPLCAETSSIR